MNRGKNNRVFDKALKYFLFTLILNLFCCNQSAYKYLNHHYYTKGENIPGWSSYLLKNRELALKAILEKTKLENSFFMVENITNFGNFYSCILYTGSDTFFYVKPSSSNISPGLIDRKAPFADYLYDKFQKERFDDVLKKSEDSQDLRGVVYVTSLIKKEDKFSIDKFKINIFLTEEEEKALKERKEFIRKMKEEYKEKNK